jgi:signal transduction histidine kinase
MRLLTKTTLYFLAVIIPLLSLAAFFLFNKFSKEINNRSDQELVSDETEWIRYLETALENGTSFSLKTPEIVIVPTGAALTEYPRIENTYGHDAKGNETIPYRQLSQVVSINDAPYQITIRQSQTQKAALVKDITNIVLLVFVLLFAATVIFNWVISKNIWAPFRRSLNKIRAAELQKMEALHFEKTGTREFNELNESLNFMTSKIYRDYVNMKEFTENAAHEMQTPIAVAQSKMELLLQDSNLTEEQIQSVLQASDVLNRLGKLSQSLLLLAKIENNQYTTIETVNLTDVTKKYLQLFNEFITEKQLNIKTTFDEDFEVKLHPFLADSLITNLLGNAIKYNYQGGTISIDTSANSYTISNTSLQKPISKEKLFSRMQSSKEQDEASNGLGLAIVKKIVDANNMRISYVSEIGSHRFFIEAKTVQILRLKIQDN